MLGSTNWPLVRLQNLVLDLQSGFAQRPLTDGTGIPQLRTNNVSPDGELDLSQLSYVTAAASDRRRYGVRRGDVIFNNTNSVEWVGKTAYFGLENSDTEYVLSNHMTRIRADERLIEPEFLAIYLHYLWKSGFSSRFAKHWVNQAAVDQSALVQYLIPVPPLSEQRHIVSILNQAAALRRLRTASLTQVRQIVPAIFLQMFGDPAVNPHNWPKQPLVQLSIKMSDGPFGSNLKTSHYTERGIRVVRLQNIGVGRFLDKDKVYVSQEHFKSLSRHHCAPGDILIGTLGDPNLRACLLPEFISEALNKADCVQFVPKTDLVTGEYICWLLNNPSTLNLASGMVHGQTRTRISMGRIRDLLLPVPPLPLQQYFSHKVAQITQAEDWQKQSVHEMRDLHEALLAQAFTGKLTEAWRESNADVLPEEAFGRNTLLGLPRTFPPTIVTNEFLTDEVSTQSIREGKLIGTLHFPRLDARRALRGSQAQVLALAEKTTGYFTATSLSQGSNLRLRVVEDSLALLDAMGLIRAAQVTVQPSETPFLVTAYRLLQPEDLAGEGE